MYVSAVLVAAGRGSRMGTSYNKIFMRIKDQPLLVWSLKALDACPLINHICVVAAQGEEDLCESYCKQASLRASWQVVVGGDTRQRSVYHGLMALPRHTDIVAVHDAARPLISAHIVEESILSARQNGSGVVGVQIKDTVKVVDGGIVRQTPNRAELYSVQTPQTFRYNLLMNAYEQARQEGFTSTDDASLVEHAGHAVYMVEGDYQNIKVTTPEDMRIVASFVAEESAIAQGVKYARTGLGYDVHQLVEGRKLILGGVEILFEKGLLGHSDADVLLHALMDALLGAAALGDIGKHFPDTDGKFKGASSLLLLEKVVNLLKENGFHVHQADITLLAQRPKIAPYIPQMIENIANALQLPQKNINIKATTTEGLGFVGQEDGMAAMAVATVLQVGKRIIRTANGTLNRY